MLVRPAVGTGQARGPGGGRGVRAQPDVRRHARAPADDSERRAATTSTRPSPTRRRAPPNLVSRQPRSARHLRRTAPLGSSRSRSTTIAAGTGGDGEVLADRAADRRGHVQLVHRRGRAGGGIRLTTGVDERGVPLAPNAIVLPKSAGNSARRRWSPRRSACSVRRSASRPRRPKRCPPGVLFVKRQTVIDRGVDLAEAGERIEFGEPLDRVVQDLLLDWLGNTARSTPASIRFCGRPRPAPRSSPRSRRSSRLDAAGRRHLPTRRRSPRRRSPERRICPRSGKQLRRRGAAADGLARAWRRGRAIRHRAGTVARRRRPRSMLDEPRRQRAARRRRRRRARHATRSSSSRAPPASSTSASSSPAPHPGNSSSCDIPASRSTRRRAPES